MDQNTVALRGVNNEMNLKLRRCVVQLAIYLLPKPNTSDWKPFCVIPGVIVVSGDGFCHIITHKGIFCNKDSANWQYEVVFPDGTKEQLNTTDITIARQLASFFIATETGMVDVVEFGKQNALQNEDVQMFGFDRIPSAPSQLCNGNVTHLGEGYFCHDRPPSYYSAKGSPVFNKQGELVGISYMDRGVTFAMDLDYITGSLSEFYEGMENKPIPKILQHVKGKATTNLRSLRSLGP